MGWIDKPPRAQAGRGHRADERGGLIAAYAVSRILMQAFAQLRDGIFAKVQYHAHARGRRSRPSPMSTRCRCAFIWSARPAASRASSSAAPRASTRCCPSRCSASFPPSCCWSFYSAILLVKLNVWIALTTLVMVVAYVWFTFAITRWRIQFRRDMNQSDTRRQHQGGGQPAQLRDGQIFQQ